MIVEKIKKLIATELNVPVEKIKPETKIIEDLGADSVDVMQMIISLEGEFKISIPDEDVQKMATFQGIIDVVSSKIKE